MDLQLTNSQKLVIFIAAIVIIAGGLFAAEQAVRHNRQDQKKEACVRASSYHQKNPSASHVLTIDDAICGNG